MPFVSTAQRGFMYSQHPELAEEFEAATPKGKKLPKKLHPERNVKKAYALGLVDAFDRFGLKQAGEEIRLKIPNREFHGFDAAFRTAAKVEKKANGQPPLEPQADPSSPVEQLTKLLQGLEPPPGSSENNTSKDKLERDVMWGSPSNMEAGDAANRGSSMGQNTGFGGAF